MLGLVARTCVMCDFVTLPRVACVAWARDPT